MSTPQVAWGHNRTEKPEVNRKRLFTVEEAGFYLGRSVWSIRHLIADGRLPIVRHGRRIFFDRCDLDVYIERNKIPFN